MARYARVVMASLDVEDCVAVKLVRGRPGTGLVLGEPLRVAERLHAVGASWIHVVDLSGARRGAPSGCVLRLVRELVGRVGLRVQLGGGLRSLDALREAYSAGAEKLVVGSAWVRRPVFLEEAAAELPGAVVAAVEEGWDGLAAIHGWVEEAPRGAAWLARRASRVKGLGGLLYTQVFWEGEMRGIDVLRSRRVAVAAEGVEWLGYAGGVASVADVEALVAQGYRFIVSGMALHTWSLNPLGLLL